MKAFASALLSALLPAMACLAATAWGESPVDIGTRRQLFLDSTGIESSSGVAFNMNPPSKFPGPLVQADAPWEKALDGRVGSYCSILKDGGKFRLWYDVRFGDSVQVAYAESTDGLHFTKPVLGLHPLDGSMENNIVMPTRIGGCAVWIDSRAPSEQRYRSQSKGYNEPTAQQLYSYASPDGLTWTQWSHDDIGDCDTQSIAFWDQRVGRYVLYTRRNPNAGTPARSRIVRRLESDDLKHWDHEVVVLEADATDNATYASPTPKPPVDYYGACIFQYPDQEGVYVMLSQPFWHFYRRPEGERWGVKDVENPRSGENLGPATIDVRLGVSRDGVTFQRLGGRKPFLSLGPQGAFDSRTVWAIPNPIRMGDELWVYYVGGNTDHDGFVDPAATHAMSGVAVATMRLDGFVSADADYAGGELTTRPVRFAGDRLEVNVDTGGGGALRVEFLDEGGVAIPGYTANDATPIWGNAVRMPVTWGGRADVGDLAGKPVRLRFLMRDCRLYSYAFRDAQNSDNDPT